MFEQYSVAEAISELKTDGAKGLSGAEAARRLRQYGRNEKIGRAHV